MRKLLLALFLMFFMAGLVVALPVTVVKFDKEKKELTYKDGDKEVTATVGDKAKFTVTDAKGENAKEATYQDFEKRVGGKKGGAKVDITVKDGKITEATWKGKK